MQNAKWKMISTIGINVVLPKFEGSFYVFSLVIPSTKKKERNHGLILCIILFKDHFGEKSSACSIYMSN